MQVIHVLRHHRYVIPRFEFCDQPVSFIGLRRDKLPAQAVVSENTYRRQEASEYAEYLSDRQGKTEEEFDRWLHAFCKRKWNSDFSAEMSRSVEVMMRQWAE